MADAAEVLFYRLERAPLERVLPSLLERTLERGWRAVVQSGSAERLEALDLALWTYNDASFLPHGTARDGDPSRQPIYLTTGDETPNGAGVRFLVDGAEMTHFEGFVRIVCIFDGHDAEATGKARSQWKAAQAAGCTVTYWRQSESGRWEKQG
ncbi:MAG: DNA polymerase III subunit chi [Hyphomicrobium zavarzinii]|uniref:DNA polymerase III subunit chi n=1 Tax=Hyphomicrobium zavarzinii TaxID=48292 RepID=UPI001A4E858A|nr:DNA polymerase III subunit chi [Hyphomicrobium zavarzinii]MBL8847578.1 DNA polymerase III subunit chi [Hyphomicrobium zavarzinii]